MPVAIAALLMGCAAGYAMARAHMVRLLAAAVCGLAALFLLVLRVPLDGLPGDGYALTIVALLMAPPMAAGLIGGAVFAWLMRRHAKAT
ncbi:hypothetical protein [Tateyamaria sp. SN3-11]|uniref:hypothetical protein n=1 Tax=Tateyamaria sp. SN3-11 TaxID=3092147 RepID=UPI0039EAB782